jgi:hypothetical protein
LTLKKLTYLGGLCFISELFCYGVHYLFEICLLLLIRYLFFTFYSALTHDERVLQVDTCRAYYSGNKLYVEVDIVLERETPLWIAHDVGEALQVKLEEIAYVERAFVHVDYDSIHKPEH